MAIVVGDNGPERRRRRVFDPIGLMVRGGLWLAEMVRLPTRGRRSRRDEAAGLVQMGELLVMVPNTAVTEVVVADAFRGWSSRHLRVSVNRAETFESSSRRSLRHGYLRVSIRPGHERDALRRLRAFARLRRLSVRAIRNPLVRPASAVPTGAHAEPVEFLAPYWSGCARTRVDRSGESGGGVRILIVDQDVHPDDLPAQVHRVGAMVRAGNSSRFSQDDDDATTTTHGRLVAAIIADLAPRAQIRFLGVHLLRSGDVPLWTLLTALLRERDADLVNFSWEVAGMTVDREEYESFLTDMIADLSGYGTGALYLCPTGNAQPHAAELSTIALPARLATVAAIGSIHEHDRAPDSRYGVKEEGWWLCPGGSRDAPIARIGTTNLHGTSFAAAFATGLLAGVAEHLAAGHRLTATDLRFLSTCDELEATTTSRTDRDHLMRLIDQLRANWTRSRSRLLAAMHERADPSALTVHDHTRHGLGLLVSGPVGS